MTKILAQHSGSISSSSLHRPQNAAPTRVCSIYCALGRHKPRARNRMRDSVRETSFVTCVQMGICVCCSSGMHRPCSRRKSAHSKCYVSLCVAIAAAVVSVTQIMRCRTSPAPAPLVTICTLNCLLSLNCQNSQTEKRTATADKDIEINTRTAGDIRVIAPYSFCQYARVF